MTTFSKICMHITSKDTKSQINTIKNKRTDELNLTTSEFLITSGFVFQLFGYIYFFPFFDHEFTLFDYRGRVFILPSIILIHIINDKDKGTL